MSSSSRTSRSTSIEGSDHGIGSPLVQISSVSSRTSRSTSIDGSGHGIGSPLVQITQIMSAAITPVASRVRALSETFPRSGAARPTEGQAVANLEDSRDMYDEFVGKVRSATLSPGGSPGRPVPQSSYKVRYNADKHAQISLLLNAHSLQFMTLTGAV